MANGLASELNKPVDPFDIVSQVSSGTLEQRGAAARRERPKLMREQAQAAEEFALGTQEAKLEQVQQESKIQEDSAKSERQLIEDARRSMPIRPEINVKQYDEGSAAKTAMLTAVVGAIFGAASGRGALRAMQGVTQGAREGREDLYKAEVDRFDRELAKWKDEVSTAKEILKESRELLNTDKGAALAKLKELDPTLNRGLVKMGIRTQNLNKVDEYLDQAQKGIDAIELEFAKATAREAAKGPSMPAAAKKDLEAKVGLRNTLGNLIAELDREKYEPPALAKVMTAQGAQDLVELSRRFPERFKDTAKFQNFMAKVERTNAPERHSLYGANLTRNELPRYNITVPTYSDSSKTIRKILQDRLDSVNESIALKQQMYARAGQIIDTAEVQPQDFVSSYGAGPAALPGVSRPAISGGQQALSPSEIAKEREMAQAIMTDKNESQVRARFKERTGQDL